MTSNKVETFEEFLTNSFANGVFFRELRLSPEERDFVQKKYPKASLKKCPGSESSDGKCWYEVNLLPSAPLENDLQQENLRLKEELEALKKSLISLK